MWDCYKQGHEWNMQGFQNLFSPVSVCCLCLEHRNSKPNQTKPCMLQCSKPAPRARLFCFILDLIPSVKQCFFYFSSIFDAGCQCGFGSLSSRQGVLDFQYLLFAQKSFLFLVGVKSFYLFVFPISLLGFFFLASYAMIQQ